VYQRAAGITKYLTPASFKATHQLVMDKLQQICQAYELDVWKIGFHFRQRETRFSSPEGPDWL
jgi:hypothetical protein